MSDGCKLILSLFTGCKKQKAWNKLKKYMPVKRRQIETGDHITIKRMVGSIFRP